MRTSKSFADCTAARDTSALHRLCVNDYHSLVHYFYTLGSTQRRKCPYQTMSFIDPVTHHPDRKSALNLAVPLPEDVVNCILDYLSLDPLSLRAYSLVHRNWTVPGQAHMFRTVTLLRVRDWDKLDALLDRSVHIRSLIRSLVVSSCPQEHIFVRFDRGRLANVFPHVTELSFIDVPPIYWLATGLPQINKITVGGRPVPLGVGSQFQGKYEGNIRWNAREFHLLNDHPNLQTEIMSDLRYSTKLHGVSLTHAFGHGHPELVAFLASQDLLEDLTLFCRPRVDSAFTPGM
jgi:hypothetical protein